MRRRAKFIQALIDARIGEGPNAPVGELAKEVARIRASVAEEEE